MTKSAIHEWRKKRLDELSKAVGGNKALGKLLGYEDGAFVGSMIKGTRPITEKTIQKIHSIDKFSEWFSNGPSALGSPVLEKVQAAQDGKDLSPTAYDLGRLLDRIPVDDTISRMRAFTGASTAIFAVLDSLPATAPTDRKS